MRNLISLLVIILASLIYSCGHNSASNQQNEEEMKQELSSKENGKDCCKKSEKSGASEITCPNCGYKKTETLPTEVCQLTYTCDNCKTVLHPKKGDCCVFCSYGDHKCPSKQ
jgi:hypothetical protein